MSMHCIHVSLLALALLSGARSQTAGGEPADTAPRAAGAISAAQRGSTALRPGAWPTHTLRAESTWQLNLPKGERFDASGLAMTPEGDLLTVNDRRASVYRIQFLPRTNAADLIQLPECFTPAQLQRLARGKTDRYDAEGVALDEKGRIYICEEADRWILRFDPRTREVERLPIDWTPVKKHFDLSDPNASFEGVAVGGGRLYVANERQMGRIVVVDLKNCQVVDDFSVRPAASNARDLHYSDLSWFDGLLYVLLRESRCVLAIDPKDHAVRAEYNFKEMEREPEVLYRSLFPTGQMEGVAVDRESIWLVTDNNGTGRGKHPRDIRPTLFKCRRPD